MKKTLNRLAVLAALVAASVAPATAQQVTSPCPEVLIDQKYDHVGSFRYRQQGWDTVVTCAVRTIELSTEPYIPVQYFNGTYLVESIPYNPPDTTFHSGTQLPNSADDKFCSPAVNIPYPFYFFGIRKNSFVAGGNGIITFNAAAANQFCAYGDWSPIPWNSSATSVPSDASHHKDAIYGVFQDTDPSGDVSGYQGIWYGIQDAYPCRKIVCSYLELPLFPHGSYHSATDRCTYQIVCYEGSNIIEVHVKNRGINTGWKNANGIIGIQNADGLPQQPGDIGQPNMYVVPNSPAAFYPSGYNITRSSFSYQAFRFTPQGTTVKTCEWYRIFDDGRDSVLLTTNQNDTNGYFLPMNSQDNQHPTLTKAYVSPTCVSRYVVRLNFKNANGDWYHLKDTITIGVDTARDMSLKHVSEPEGRHEHEICSGENTSVLVNNPLQLPIKRVTWSLRRILNGQKIDMPQSMFSVSGDRMSATLNPDPQADTLPVNKIDSIQFQAYVEFESGCDNYDTFLIRVFPNFDTTEVEGICKGDKFRWHVNNQIYTQTTNTPQVTLQSVPGCDSVVHLDLTVFDVSHTIDSIMDCKPIRWLNGKVYSSTNTATFEEDTIVLPNRYGCDSVVQLALTIHPLTARLESSLKEFDLDHLDVVLTDISTGGDSRRWVFPTGVEQTSPTAYYSIPADLDQADIKLIAHSPYGCIDSTNIVIPLNRETFWVPNIFTPEDPTGNNRFGSVSVNTIKQEMFIYNRYGELVFHCAGVDCTWDGNDFDGQPCRQGGYVYIIRYNTTFEPTKTITKHGSVTLIR